MRDQILFLIRTPRPPSSREPGVLIWMEGKVPQSYKWPWTTTLLVMIRLAECSIGCIKSERFTLISICEWLADFKTSSLHLTAEDTNSSQFVQVLVARDWVLVLFTTAGNPKRRADLRGWWTNFQTNLSAMPTRRSLQVSKSQSLKGQKRPL